MSKRPARLSKVTPEELAELQEKADELAELQVLLNKLPLGLQVETLSDDEIERLRQIARTPEASLCGNNLLLWNNLNRQHSGLKLKN
ncbi:hypothetical protein [Ruegeria aquimaris]|uniref:Uncharacterized protein n=1 Tax=Ruegeria aquimaris TaxID=2984333 RepID=A0ABT3AT08_9RHOB|nr:hypothetical protein [Ruegeria sp. XHP0148]MCV2891286.1 hypothetical protein [Ruegeria sp. XHP0148]